MNDTLPTETEFDFSGDSAVEVVEAVWTITDAEQEETSSDNGTGVRHVLVFESEDFPFPITMRQFVAYTPADESKNTDWVKRSRGILKNIAKAAIGEPRYSLDADSENYIVGKQVKATTRDGGDGFATLSKFRAVE